MNPQSIDDSFNSAIKSLLKSYQTKSKYFDHEIEKFRKLLIEKEDLIGQLETKLDIVSKDRDQLKDRNENLIEENNQINQEVNFLSDNFTKLENWKKNILETIGDQNINNFNNQCFRNDDSKNYNIASASNKNDNISKSLKIKTNNTKKLKEAFKKKNYETEGDHFFHKENFENNNKVINNENLLSGNENFQNDKSFEYQYSDDFNRLNSKIFYFME